MQGSNGDEDIENRLMDMVGGGEGEGGTSGESSMETNRGSVITQRGGKGWEVGGTFKREGTYVYLWLIHVDGWQKPIQCCKAITLQLKINKF